MKHTECRWWFRNFKLPIERILWISYFYKGDPVSLSHLLIPTAKTASFGWQLIHWTSSRHTIRSWWVMTWHITKFHNQPTCFDTVNSEYYCEVILHHFIKYLNEDEIACSCFQQYNTTAHTAPISATLQHDVFWGTIISKDVWPLWSLWLLPVGGNKKHILQTQSSDSPLTDRWNHKFHQLNCRELLGVSANKVRL
jgi:hypothetical protein